MPLSHIHRCPPRAGVDSIGDPAAAAEVLALAIHRPLRYETIALLLDAERRGIAIVVVSGTVDPDAVVEVTELVTTPSAHDGRVAAAVLATVRPDPRHRPAADVERWMEISEIAGDRGVELLEWFTIDPLGVSCPRDHLGEPPRW